MKKLFAILLTILYFGSSSGMVYNVHYCFNKMTISAPSKLKTCEFCASKSKKDCCKDKIKIVKLDVSQEANTQFLNNFTAVAILPENYYQDYIYPVVKQNYFSVQMNAPPEKYSPPLFISYCNFRI